MKWSHRGGCGGGRGGGVIADRTLRGAEAKQRHQQGAPGVASGRGRGARAERQHRAEPRSGSASREAEQVARRRSARLASLVIGRGRRARTQEVGTSLPGEDAGVGSPRPLAWASKQWPRLARVRFPRGRPTRGKGRDPRRKSGSQTRRESIPRRYEQSHTRRRKSSTPAFPNSAVTSTTARRHRQR